MDVIRDPDGDELKHLRQQADFADTKVLEVGCGDGRLTWQYAESASEVYGVDPDLERLRAANENRPGSLKSTLSLASSNAESLPFARNSFNLAVLAWSL